MSHAPARRAAAPRCANGAWRDWRPRTPFRIDAIGDPAGQRAAVGDNRARAQQRVIDAAEPKPDDEHDRNFKRSHEISLHQRIGQRHRPAADAFDDDAIGDRGERSVRSDDRRQEISTPASRAARCGAIGSGSANGLHSAYAGVGELACDQRFGIVVAQARRRFRGSRWRPASCRPRDGRCDRCARSSATLACVLPMPVSVPVTNTPLRIQRAALRGCSSRRAAALAVLQAREMPTYTRR